MTYRKYFEVINKTSGNIIKFSPVLSAIFQVLKKYLDYYLYKKTLDENQYSLASKIEILLLNKDNLALKLSKRHV